MSLAETIRVCWPSWHKREDSLRKLRGVVDTFRFRLGATHNDIREAFGRALGVEVAEPEFDNMMAEIDRLESL